ncbi:MAG: ABC transporter permease [Chloroflexi bacterium]|nr:ABC transporter permease [Chloroflexota bacterium]
MSAAVPRRSVGFLRRYVGVGSTLLLVVAFFSITQPTFFTLANLVNVLRSNTVLLLAGLGMTIVILGGAFDLSVESLAALAGVLLALQVRAGVPPALGILMTVLACGVLGYGVNGLLIGRLKFNFFVVTLGTLTIFRGLTLIVSNGVSISTFDWPLIQVVGDGNVGIVPVPVAIVAVCYALAYVALRRLKLGRMIYAVGGNPEAARLSGINVAAVRTLIFGISGVMAGLAGIVLTGRLTSSQPVTGALGLSLQAAAAVLLGGTSFTGGSGGVIGTVIGVLYIGVLQNGLSIAGVQSFWQQVATGAILLLALAFDRLKETR